MYYRNANCDIFIGRGAGKELLDEIWNARKSVRIVSPYLSPKLVDQLIELKRRNIEVELITSSDIEDYRDIHERNITRLIIQNRETDEVAVLKRIKWRKAANVLSIIGFCLLFGLAVLGYYLRDIRIAYGLVPVVILSFIVQYLKQRIRNKRIYNYWYSKLFPFRVYMTPYVTGGRGTFIHSKIYIIDDRIAYLGSLNFTTSGTRYNYETRIKTEDSNAIRRIREEIHRIMHDVDFPEMDLQSWGKEIYDEPIN